LAPYLRLFRQTPIPGLAIRKMAPHSAACGDRIAGFDRCKNSAMLALDHLEVSASAPALMGGDTDALAWDDETAEIVEEPPKLHVIGGGCDRMMESEIFIDGIFTAFDGGLDRSIRQQGRVT
jgi:hypothetical protein